MSWARMFGNSWSAGSMHYALAGKWNFLYLLFSAWRRQSQSQPSSSADPSRLSRSLSDVIFQLFCYLTFDFPFTFCYILFHFDVFFFSSASPFVVVVLLLCCLLSCCLFVLFGQNHFVRVSRQRLIDSQGPWHDSETQLQKLQLKLQSTDNSRR